MAAGNQHHIAPRERNARRDARSFALARVFDDLHEHLHTRLDLYALDVVKVEETVPAVAEIQEGGVHPRQHAVDPRLVYLAGPLMLKHPLDKEFVKFPLFVNDGDPDLFGVNKIGYYLF